MEEHGDVLVVDDEAAVRDMFRLVLSMSLPGQTVETAENGKAAVEAFMAKRYSVLLMDLHMPVMDGEAALERLREVCHERMWDMPAVIFCTAFAPPVWLDHILDGAERHCFLPKPVDNDTLVATVQARLAGA